MTSDRTTSHVAPETCERCGSVLLIFEEHPNGEVIYCVCGCAAETSAPRTPAVDAGDAKGVHRCVSCGRALMVIGSRKDGSSILSECPCQVQPRPDQDRRTTAREFVPRISRHPAPPRPSPAPVAPAAGVSNSAVIVGALALVVAAAVAGFWIHGRERASRPEPDPYAAAPIRVFKSDIEVLSDASGVVTRVSGTDPNEVFRAFCRHPQFNAGLVPGGLEQLTPPEPDRLIGSALLLDGVGTRRQVILTLDPKTKRWSIGDGMNSIPLGTVPAPHDSPADAAK